MNTKVFLAALAAAMSVYAVDVQITPSATLEVTQPETSAFTASLKQRKHVQISHKDAHDVIYQNRLLSNEWLKHHKLKPYEIDNIRHELEIKLANRLINEKEAGIETDDDVLMSYYKVNKKEFTIGDVVSFNAYYFKHYDDAYAFYAQFRDDSEKARSYADDHNISVKTRKDMPVLRLDSTLQFLVNERKSAPYVTVPARFRKTYLVLEITSFEKDVLMPFEKAKKKIRKVLLEKRRQDTRNKLLDALMPAEKQ